MHKGRQLAQIYSIFTSSHLSRAICWELLFLSCLELLEPAAVVLMFAFISTFVYDTNFVAFLIT